MPDHPLLETLTPQLNEMVQALRSLTVHESPSRNKVALDALADVIAARFQALGLTVERVPQQTSGDHLRVRLGPECDTRPVLVLCHFDTVWPLGTLDQMPFRVNDVHVHGPGVFDMKASLVIAEFAVRALQALRKAPPRPVVFLFTSDEEIGSPSSRALIEEEARNAAHALVLEPPLPGDRLKTARKGVGRFTLDITGRSAHAGVEPEKGVNALVELAHQILAVTRIADAGAGTTINVGLAQGGTTPNVVPAEARVEIDVRVTTLREAARVEAALRAIEPTIPGATLTLHGGFNRPPMERTPQTAALFERARAIGATLGLQLGEGSTGGGSDGNFTAALGLPTLDGLGVPGSGAHADHEHIVLESLAVRAALLAALLLEL